MRSFQNKYLQLFDGLNDQKLHLALNVYQQATLDLMSDCLDQCQSEEHIRVKTMKGLILKLRNQH